jgi:hypothetical protein
VTRALGCGRATAARFLLDHGNLYRDLSRHDDLAIGVASSSGNRVGDNGRPEVVDYSLVPFVCEPSRLYLLRQLVFDLYERPCGREVYMHGRLRCARVDLHHRGRVTYRASCFVRPND